MYLINITYYGNIYIYIYLFIFIFRIGMRMWYIVYSSCCVCRTCSIICAIHTYNVTVSHLCKIRIRDTYIHTYIHTNKQTVHTYIHTYLYIFIVDKIVFVINTYTQQDHVHTSMIAALQQLLPRMATPQDINQLITTITANVCMYVCMHACRNYCICRYIQPLYSLVMYVVSLRNVFRSGNT